MKSAEFLLSHGNNDIAVIIDACQSAELQAVDFGAFAWNDGPVLELFTAEEYQSKIEKIRSLSLEDQVFMDIYIATSSRIWDETRTQAAIPALLCEYANIEGMVTYLETEDGRKYLCRSKL